MNGRKKQIIFEKLIRLLLAGFLCPVLFAQGIPRSTGLGFRGGFWKINNQVMGVHVGTSGLNSSVRVEGAGGSLTFFSRLHQNWFIESSLGSVANVNVEEKNLFDEDVRVSVTIPLLVGVRFDLLSSRLESKIQPYLCAGTGTYWLMDTAVEDHGFMDEEVSTESDFFFGGYVGGGSHVTLASWFALDFITQYHFVDFSKSHPKSGFEFGMGFCFMWGRKREIFKVKEVQVIVPDIYPAYYRFYNSYPLAMATIENTAGFPIEVNLRSWIDGYTDGVRQSGFIEIPKGETSNIPVHLLFGPDLLTVENREPAVIDLEIEARAGVTLKKSFSAQVVMHSRNAWNGEIDKLTVFVTPDDPEILELSRSYLKADTVAEAADPMKLHQARILFDALGTKGLTYQADPNIPYDRDDRVQFAPKTLSLGTGDCDDLVVLVASLFESVGIRTAFVDVRDPQTPQGHVYLMFDTGLSPDGIGRITGNEKRIVIRENASGESTIWIPVETTLIQAGFETAWKTGATQYMEEAVLRQGLEEGWVNVIDVD
ncbi:transglutaminase domain-containing protein [bacterium]|nr:transglutaminase domain-containing protein [bacterium]